MNKYRGFNKFFLIFMMLTVLILGSRIDFAATTISIPDINITVQSDTGDVQIANSIQIIVLLTILSLAPSILIMMTSFTDRKSVV